MFLINRVVMFLLLLNGKMLKGKCKFIFNLIDKKFLKS